MSPCACGHPILEHRFKVMSPLYPCGHPGCDCRVFEEQQEPIDCRSEQ